VSNAFIKIQGLAMDEEQRTQLLQEYYNISSFVQAYDGHFLAIKSWGITVSGAAIGVGFSQGLLGQASQVGIFFVALILSVAFWLTELRFKLIQLAHVYRQSDLEQSLREDTYIKTPAILQSYGMGRTIDRERKRWRSVMFWPHVMLPHILFAAISLILIGYSILDQILR
jgi:hypothetical protein